MVPKPPVTVMNSLSIRMLNWLVGKPVALLLLQANATVTVCHSRTDDLARQTLEADILVAAVGHPVLITADMVRSMRPGSIIVDLAVERGGNVELAKPGEVADVNGVKIVGHLNVPGRLAATASSLYAKNLYAFLEILIDKNTKALAVNWDDEIVKATMLTRDGAVVHASFQPKSAA